MNKLFPRLSQQLSGSHQSSKIEEEEEKSESQLETQMLTEEETQSSVIEQGKESMNTKESLLL